MRRSLRFRLTVAIVGVLTVLLIGLSIVLHAIFSRALYRQLDGRLLGDAAAVAGMAEDESPQAEFESESLPDFEPVRRPAYFEAWLDDGQVLARSPSLGARDLVRSARPTGPLFTDLILPDARAGRAVQLRQPMRIDEPSMADGGARRVSGRFVTVVVGRGTEELAETLAGVRLWLLRLVLLSLLGASGVALVVVSRGLRSTRALAIEIAGLDATRLNSVLPSVGLPTEIAPVVAKFNQLLARLRESFAREKRFTADVSHELRNPLAALRTTLEVAASRDRGASEYRAAIEQGGALVLELQALCENLLSLARLDAGLIPAHPQEIPLRILVQACWRPFEARARERRLSFQNQIDAESRIASDPDYFRVIVSNILSNAATYTAPGGIVRVRRRVVGNAPGLWLEVLNTGPRIPDEVLPHIFERFFRGDPTRADGVHCGIGLALVRGISDALGLAVTAHNTTDGGVSFAVGHR
jgi:two-component system heavy metal sensor histidine kinase CusS